MNGSPCFELPTHSTIFHQFLIGHEAELVLPCLLVDHTVPIVAFFICAVVLCRR